MCASAVFHLPLIPVSQLWSVERGILVPLWLCCLTPYTSRYSPTRTTSLISRRGTPRGIYQLAIIYSSPTVPRPRHIAFSHLDLSVSQKNRTPPFFRNYDVRYESVTSHLACKVLTPHTYPSFLRTYYLIFPESVHRSYPLRAYCDRTCTRRLGKAHKEGGPDLKRSGRAPDL